MKDTYFIYIFLLISIITCIIYERSQLFNMEDSVTEFRPKEAFEDVMLYIPGHIHFIHSTDSLIRIKGPSSVIEHLDFKVDGQTLHINAEDYFLTQNWKRLLYNKASKLHIYIPVTSPAEYIAAGLLAPFADAHRQDDQLSIHTHGLTKIHVYKERSRSGDLSGDVTALVAILE